MNLRKSKLLVHRRSTVAKKASTATKVRTRIRKPRYASLTRLDQKTDELDDDMDMKLIDLFPIRTAKAEDLSVNMSRISEYFFTSECDSLTELLNSEDSISLSVEVAPVYNEGVDREEKLVKTALRSRERDEIEEEEGEKWVSYSEVVSSSVLDQKRNRVMKLNRLKLKLDYKEVLDAWDGGQIVPCFDDDDDLFADDRNGGLSVPEHKTNKVMIKDEECMGNWEKDELKWKMGKMREASLLRYKEKRRNRLFSKRIRYEVRKLNAEKRPRIKGRFVKRD